MPQNNYAGILDLLRVRISLVPPGEEAILKETELSKEFGMSRTPIRQVLQSLEREHMLAIRSGYGSCVLAYDPEERSQSFQLLRDLSWATARYCENVKLDQAKVIEYAAIAQTISSANVRDAESYVTLAGRLILLHLTEVKDPILRDALMSTFWRVLRWRADDVRNDPEATWDVFTRTTMDIRDAAETGSFYKVMQAIAGIGDDFVEQIKKAEEADKNNLSIVTG